jgi:hypothetical protein
VLVARVEAQVDRMPHDDRLMTRGHHHACPYLSEFAPSAKRYFVALETCKMMRETCMIT